MKHKLLLFVVFTFTFHLLPFTLRAQSWQWENWMGGAGQRSGSDQEVTGIGTDNSGNTYVAGRVMPYASFGTYTVPFSYNVSYQGFLTRYDCAGNLKWVYTFGDNTDQTLVSGLAVDASGNSYIVGNIANSDSIMHFGDSVIHILSHANFGKIFCFFVAKYDSSGNLKWVNFAQTVATPQFSGNIAINSAGTIIVCGFNTLVGTTWPGINLVHGDFFAAFSPLTGSALWGTMIDTMPPNADYLGITAMKLDADDDIYLTGWFNDTVNIGHYKLTSSNLGFHGFIIKYNVNAILKWAKQDYSASDGSGFNTMTISGANMYLEGTALQGDNILGYNITFAGTSVQGNFILKLDTGANLQWGITQDSINFVYSGPNGSMTTDNSGNLYFISGYANYLKWGTTYPSINSYNNIDNSYNNCAPYLLELNPAGNVLSLKPFDCYGDTAIFYSVGGEQITFNNLGEMIIGGAFNRWMIVGNDTIADDYGNDCLLFLAKYGNACSTTTAFDNIKAEPEINVYPNPARDQVTFESSLNDANLKGEIYNVLGQLVQTLKLNSDLTTISTNNLSRGIYLYRILREDSVLKTGKIALQ